MTPLFPPLSQTETDRLCALASIGADLASKAFGQLLGGTVAHRAPRICGPADPADPDRWCTGIVVEAAGDLTGLVAIVMPESDRDRAVEMMVGEADPHDRIVESALRELGNIIVSQTVSAIADSLSPGSASAVLGSASRPICTDRTARSAPSSCSRPTGTSPTRFSPHRGLLIP
jgi:chemotaxis protein CheY-P-specific phosphatase CheC